MAKMADRRLSPLGAPIPHGLAAILAAVRLAV
jgi:hypothetical protein